jgi:DNA-binding transcriptional ArsR family regulator
MNEIAEEQLDRAFLALADPIRRRIIARLSKGPATVNELAEPFEVTKQAISRHIQVLESADLVTRTRDAQRRPVHLNAGRLESLTAWIDRYRLTHEERFRSLDEVLRQKPGQKPGGQSRKSHARKTR